MRGAAPAGPARGQTRRRRCRRPDRCRGTEKMRVLGACVHTSATDSCSDSANEPAWPVLPRAAPEAALTSSPVAFDESRPLEEDACGRFT